MRTINGGNDGQRGTVNDNDARGTMNVSGCNLTYAKWNATGRQWNATGC